MRTQSWICALCVVAGSACGASTQAERVRHARIETIDTQTVAKTRAIEERQEAREQAIQQHHDLAKANPAKSSGGMSDAALSMAEERALYQSKARGRVETLGVRIEAARKKLGAMNGKAPMDMRAQLDAIQSVHEGMQMEVEALQTTPETQWEATKQGVDDRLTKLDERIKTLTEEIENS